LFAGQRGHVLHQRGRDHDGAVAIGHDHVVGEDGHAAAAHRLLPVDEGQSSD